MSAHNNAARPEITPGQAGELLLRVRTASQAAAGPDEVASLRDALEPCIASCNHWLALLREWVGRGLLVEAASVNDSYPELCKVAHLLAMPEERLGWDQACNRAGVAPNSRIDESAYLELSDAIADASSLEEFVQRFQIAVLARRPLAARIKALQGLLAAAPRNEAIRSLAKRFESEALASLEEGCRKSAAEGRPEDLSDALEAIEGLGWESQFSAEFVGWLRAEIARHNRAEADRKYAGLAPRIEAAFAARDLMLLGSIAEECEQVEREHGVEPGDEFRARTRDGLQWADAQREALRIAAEHANECEAMRRALDQGFSYTELEPMRGRILRFGIGIPEDIESRFGTVHSAWKSARRRLAATVAGLAALGVACTAAVIAYLAWTRAEQQRAENTAARVATMLEGGEYEEARRLVDEIRQSEPWMLEVPAVGSVDSRIREEAPKYDARRTQIKALLKRAGEAGETDVRSIEECSAALAAALASSEPTTRPTPEEGAALRSEIDRLRRAVVQVEERERLRRESEFSELRRSFAQLPPAQDRAPKDRLSIPATEQYLRDSRTLDGQVRGYLDAAPPQDAARAEAQSMLDRLSKDVKSAEDLLPRLREAESLMARIRSKPASESEFLGVLVALTDQYSDVAAAADGASGRAIGEARRMARAATALEHWRNEVLVAIRAKNSADGIAIPSRRQDAGALAAVLQSHVDAHPYSPHAAVARSWKLLCDRAAASTLDTSVQDAMMALSDAGLMRLDQVPLKGGRWAFVRDDVTVANALSGLVQELQDLSCPPGQLRTDLEIAQQVAGRRGPAPWRTVVDSGRERLATADMVDAQAQWLRMMEAVRGGAGQTDDMARMMAMMAMWGAYARHLAVAQGPDEALARELARLRKSEASFLACDWPRLALKPASNGDRKRQQEAAQALRRQMPNFEKEADLRMREFEAQRVAARPAELVGVLLPAAAGEASRRCSPADLAGEGHEVLAWDPGPQAWVLRPAAFENGILTTDAAGVAPYSLIYRRK